MGRPGNAHLLTRARRRGAVDHRASPAHQQGLIDDAIAHLGKPRVSHRLFRSNRNSDLHLFERGEQSWLLKISVSKPGPMIEEEFHSLEALHRLAGRQGSFRVPRPVALFEGRSAYLMERVDGNGLGQALIRDGMRFADAERLCRTCGELLAALHARWHEPDGSLDAAGLGADLSELPFNPTVSESQLLQRVLQRLDGTAVARARLYLDFDPANVMLSPTNQIVLIDPPESRVIDAVHWDLGTFAFGLFRLAWSRPLALRRWGRWRARLSDAFVDAYRVASSGHASSNDDLLIQLGELFRLAQLWIWWLRPSEHRHVAVGLARSVYAYPLLQSARRTLFRRLARGLKR